MICFQKLHMGVYLRTKFQVSSMILTGFRLAGGGGGGGGGGRGGGGGGGGGGEGGEWK